MSFKDISILAHVAFLFSRAEPFEQICEEFIVENIPVKLF